MGDTDSLLQSIKNQHYELSLFIQQQSLIVDKIVQGVRDAYQNDNIVHTKPIPPENNVNTPSHKLHFPALNRVLKSHAKRSGKEFTPIEFEMPSKYSTITKESHISNEPTIQLDIQPNIVKNNYNSTVTNNSDFLYQNNQIIAPQRKPPQAPPKHNENNKLQIEPIAGRAKNTTNTKTITTKLKNTKKEREEERHEELIELARRISAAITIQRAWRGSADFRRYVSNHRAARAHRKRVVLAKLLMTWRDYVAMRRWWRARWQNLVRCWGIKNIHLHLGREFPVTYLTLTEGKYVMAARYHAWRTIRKYFLKWQHYMSQNEDT